MVYVGSMVRLAVLFAAAVAVAAAAPGAGEPQSITSDTVDYCDALASRMATQAELPEDARVLLIEGRAMCDHGHVMGGLRRLRLAMLILRGRSVP